MRFSILPVLLLASALSAAQSEPAKKSVEQSEDHQASIHGIRIGMTTPQVLELLGGRMPDRRKDEKGEIIVYWKLEGGDVLQVNFRKENYVSHIALQFKPPRPTNDFWLVPYLGAPARLPESRTLSSEGSELTPLDPRWRRDYRTSESKDHERTVWVREQKAPAGYRIEVSFLSAARKQLGDSHTTKVDFKYVSVNRNDLKKFDQAMTGKK